MNIVFIPIAGVVGIIALVIIRAIPDESKNNKLYKGLTNNLDRRLKEHKSGKTITTSRMKNLEVLMHSKKSSRKKAPVNSAPVG